MEIRNIALRNFKGFSEVKFSFSSGLANGFGFGFALGLLEGFRSSVAADFPPLAESSLFSVSSSATCATSLSALLAQGPLHPVNSVLEDPRVITLYPGRELNVCT